MQRLLGTLWLFFVLTCSAHLPDRLLTSTDPLQRTVRFGYDADGRRLTTTNAALEVTRQQWTARGEAVALTDGGKGSERGQF